MRADLLSVKDGNESCAGDWCGTRGQVSWQQIETDGFGPSFKMPCKIGCEDAGPEMDFSDVRSLSCELDASKRSRLLDCGSASNISDATEGFEGTRSKRRDKLLEELHVLHYDLCSLASV